MCIFGLCYISLITEINYFLTKPRKVFLEMNPLGLPSKCLYFFRLTRIIALFGRSVSSLELLELVCSCHSVSFSNFTAMRLCYKIESMKYL